ncbi:tetratricopeptide repeat protein [Parasphingorhabdus sp. DH2-15]|uniref:tetratricopeptide repeat protein n=1 Tax=Parasphingorhabdus sp. DH2-15 TaxID=3444112 RepID=UPI003F688010
MLALPSSRTFSLAVAAITLVASTALSAPAIAQSNNLDRRVERLEAEVRAVQRKVFPGGSERFFEPEVQSETPTQSQNSSNASPVLADLLARVDALEAQLAGLTSQTEENSFRLGQIENRLQSIEAAEKAREEAQAAATTTAASDNGPAAAAPGAALAAEPSAERIAAVSAIIKPESDDAGEDDYIYGFRLWDAGFYPEAQQQLRLTLEKHPNHARNSHARNLLGRALLDGGKPQSAAKILLENYQTNPRGARAPDSLYFLGAALIAAKDNEKACAAFDELADAYPDAASGRLATRLSSGRETAGCS